MESNLTLTPGHLFPTAQQARERHGHYVAQQGLGALTTLRERAQWGADPSGYLYVKEEIAKEVQVWLQWRGFEVEQYATDRLYVKPPALEVRRQQSLDRTPSQVQEHILRALDAELQQKMHGPHMECLFQWPWVPRPEILDRIQAFLTQQGFGVSTTPTSILITWSTHKLQTV